MKLTVIGAGNMGGAIVRALVASSTNHPASAIVAPADITVVDTNAKTLELMSTLGVNVSTSGVESVVDADMIILAVKPWLASSVLAGIAPSSKHGVVVASIAAGIDFDVLGEHFPSETPLVRIIPNTAVTVGQSMTFVTGARASVEVMSAVVRLFEPLGPVMEIPASQIGACTSLASCGIAFALRYIRAAMEGGIEMGIPPLMAQHIVAQTVRGASELLLAQGTHPEVEIDKVTTPGGITIRGLNAMEESGFTNAVIKGLKASK